MLRFAIRNSRQLSDSLLHRLDLYAVAASAAGVGLLALAPPAMAKIVYTKADQPIGLNGTYSIDLNHDGVVDFLIQQSPGVVRGLDFSEVFAKAALGNGVQGAGAALISGQKIGPSQFFASTGLYGERMAYINRTSTFGHTKSGGPWANVENRYLGLKFKIIGQSHY